MARHRVRAAGVRLRGGLYDVSTDALARGRAGIERLFAKAVELGKTDRKTADDAEARLTTSADLDDVVRDAGLIIEAVPSATKHSTCSRRASAEDIDKALKLGLNHPMGSFELGDLAGLDTRVSVLQHLHRTLGEKYRPCPLLVRYVEAGRLGRKVGRGVFDYRGR